MGNSYHLIDVAEVFSGSAVERSGNGASAVMVGDLTGTGVLPPELTSVGPPKTGLEASLRAGDIVISLRGNANNCAVVTLDTANRKPAFATLDLAVIRISCDALVTPEYLATYLNLPSTQMQLSEHRSGTAALRLPLGALRELEIPVPTIERQRTIVALSKCAAEERALTARLGALRTDMINELLRQAAGRVPGSPASTRNSG